MVVRNSRTAPSSIGQRLDGSYDWLAIALFCQRETTRLRNGKEREFVDDMASRLSFPGPVDMAARDIPSAMGSWRNEDRVLG
jgi:hypothetical protein